MLCLVSCPGIFLVAVKTSFRSFQRLNIHFGPLNMNTKEVLVAHNSPSLHPPPPFSFLLKTSPFYLQPYFYCFSQVQVVMTFFHLIADDMAQISSLVVQKCHRFLRINMAEGKIMTCLMGFWSQLTLRLFSPPQATGRMYNFGSPGGTQVFQAGHLL